MDSHKCEPPSSPTASGSSNQIKSPSVSQANGKETHTPLPTCTDEGDMSGGNVDCKTRMMIQGNEPINSGGHQDGVRPRGITTSIKSDSDNGSRPKYMRSASDGSRGNDGHGQSTTANASGSFKRAFSVNDSHSQSGYKDGEGASDLKSSGIRKIPNAHIGTGSRSENNQDGREYTQSDDKYEWEIVIGAESIKYTDVPKLIDPNNEQLLEGSRSENLSGAESKIHTGPLEAMDPNNKQLSEGAQSENSSGMNELVTAWPSDVELQIFVKTTDGLISSDSSVQNGPALQFLTWEKVSLEGIIHDALTQKFIYKLENINEKKIKVIFNLESKTIQDRLTWIKEIKEEVTKLINSLFIREIAVPRGDLKTIRRLEEELLLGLLNKVNIYIQNSGRLVIVGHKPEADKIYTKVQELFQSQHTTGLVDQIICIGFDDGILFQRLGEKDRMQENHTQVQVVVEGERVRVTGPEKMVSRCIQDVQNWHSKIKCFEGGIQRNFVKLLAYPETKAYIENYVHQNGIVWIHIMQTDKEKVKVFANSEQVAKLAFQMIVECMKEEVLKSPGDSPIYGTPEYTNFRETNIGKKLIEIANTDQSVTLVATKDVMDDFLKLRKRPTKESPAIMGMKRKESAIDSTFNFETSSVSKGDNKVFYLKQDFEFLLKDKSFKKKLEELYPSVSIIESDGKMCMVFKGTQADIEDQARKVDMFYKEIPCKKELIVYEKHTLLEEVAFFVSKQLVKRNIHCYWWLTKDDSTHSCHVHVRACSVEIARKGLCLINEINIQRISVHVTPEIQKKLKEIEIKYSENMLLSGNEVGSDELCIVASADIIDILNKEINITLYSEHFTESFIVRFEKHKYLKQFMQDEVARLEKKFDVMVILEKPRCVVIKGTSNQAKQVAECEAELKDICMRILYTDYVVLPSESTSKVRSSEGRVFLKGVGTANNCLLTSKIDVPQQVFTFSLLDQDLHLVIVHGRTTNLAVDVVICPVTEGLYPFGYADDLLKGNQQLETILREHLQSAKTDTYKKLKIGEVRSYMPGSTYPCQTIMLTVMYHQHKIINLSEMKEAIIKALEECDKAKVQSVAIPVQVHESIEVSLQADVCLSALEQFFIKKRSVQEVYVCVLYEDQLDEVIEVFAAKVNASFARWDWRPTFSFGEISGKGQPLKANLIKGSLVDEQVDIIVNTTGITLNLNEGAVSKSILERAGTTIQTECSTKAPVPYGEVVVTNSGNLFQSTGCKYICHGVLLEWFHRTGLSLKVLKSLIWKCLRVADERQCSSIAFPAFGTGNLKYPPHEVAKTMYETVDMYGKLTPKTHIKDVRILIYYKDERHSKIFSSVEKKIRREESVLLDLQSKHEPMLQCLVPLGSGNVTVQVIPWLPLKEPQEALLVQFDCKNEDFVEETDGTLILSYTHKWTFDKAVQDAFIRAEEYRITTVAFLFSRETLGYKTLNLEAKIKVVKDMILFEKEVPYLHVVRMYVEDETQFTKMLNNPNKEEEKTGMLNHLMETVGFKKQKRPTIWKVIYSSNQEEPMIISVTGKQQCVSTAKNKIKRYFTNYQKSESNDKCAESQVPKKVRQWYRVIPKSNARKALPEDVCKRLDFALEKKDEFIVEMETNKVLWVYKIREMECYKHVDLNVKYRLENDGTSVDVAAQKTDKNDEDIFSSVTGHLNWKLINANQSYIVNDVLKQYNITPIQLSNAGDKEIVCQDIDELKKVNKALKKALKVDHDIVFFNTQNSKQKPNNDSNKGSRNRKYDDDLEVIVTYAMSPLEFKMLKFFSGDCQLLLTGKYTYDDGKILRTLVKGEKEDDLNIVYKAKMKDLQTITSVEVQYEPGINDEIMHQLEHELSSTGEMLCHRTEDKKTLILYGFSYEKLGEGKHRAEIILGLKQQSKGRKNRKFVTDQDLTKDDRNKSHQSSPEGTKSMSTTQSAAPVLDQSYKTSEGIVIRVYNGNILQLNVECIVNAANDKLSHGGGIAEVISRAAGYKLNDECDKYLQQNGSLKVGTSCSTTAGNLPYKRVIHTVGPNWYQYTDKILCCSHLKMAVESCLYEAVFCNMSSIAVPSISAGIFGVPVEICTEQYARAVEEFSKKNGRSSCLREIHFIDKDIGLVSAIQNKFNQNFTVIGSSGSTIQTKSPPSQSMGKSSGGANKSTSKSENQDFSSQERVTNPTAESVKFPKQYLTSSGLKLFVIVDSITSLTVDAVVCPQDDLCRSLGAIAKAIEKNCDESYKRAVAKMGMILRTEVKKCKATPAGVPFKYVVHTVPPRYDIAASYDKQKFMRELELTVRNIIRHANDSKDIKTVALPLLGIGADGKQTPLDMFVSLITKTISQESQQEKFKLQEIYIVTNDKQVAEQLVDLFDKEQAFKVITSFQRSRRNKSTGQKENADEKALTGSGQGRNSGNLGMTVKGGNLENCVICMDTPSAPRKLNCGHIFCEDCIRQQFNVKPVCPTCGSIQGVVTGDQPPGSMKVKTSSLSLPGNNHCGRIEIEYVIHPGKQGPEHPNEGARFDGITRVAYLPDNEQGKKIAKLLRVAFDRRLIFTIGRSRTTDKEGVVTWNDIHHKTNPNPGKQFGYPDDTYFDRVLDELKAKGVTEKDL